MKAPRTLFELWMWGHDEWLNSQNEPPIQLHAKHPLPERDDLPKTLFDFRRRKTQHPIRSLITGRPFNRAFIRYLDNVRPMTAARIALRSMRSRDRAQSPEYRLCLAVVEAGHGIDEAMAVAGVNERIAEDALRYLWAKTQHEVSIADARRKQPSQVAGRRA